MAKDMTDRGFVMAAAAAVVAVDIIDDDDNEDDVTMLENGVIVRVAVVRPDPPDVISISHDVSYRWRVRLPGWMVVVEGSVYVVVDILVDGNTNDDGGGDIIIIRCCIHRRVGVIRKLDMEANGIGIMVLARIDTSQDRCDVAASGDNCCTTPLWSHIASVPSTIEMNGTDVDSDLVQRNQA
jgi:hypothetical protein